MELLRSADLIEYLVSLWLLLAILVALLIFKTANRKLFQWHTYVTCFLGYYCAAGIVLLCPLDLALTIERRQVNNGHLDELSRTIETMYQVCYWPCFVLGSFVMGWLEIYVQNGYFTPLSRALDATKRMSKDYAAMAVAGAVVLGILAGSGAVSGGSDVIKTTCIALSNTVGLCAIVVLLGYGLVELPRTLWKNGDLRARLQATTMRSSEAFKALKEAGVLVSITVGNTIATNHRVSQSADSELMATMALVMHDTQQLADEFRSSAQGEPAVDAAGNVTTATLAELRRRLNRERGNFRAAQGRVERLKLLSYYLEDVCSSIQRDDGVEKVRWSFNMPESTHRQWVWHVRSKPAIYRLLGVVCACLSAFIVFGEIGMLAGRNSSLSVFSLIVHSHETSPRGVVAFVFFSLGYYATAVVWSLFQVCTVVRQLLVRCTERGLAQMIVPERDSSHRHLFPAHTPLPPCPPRYPLPPTPPVTRCAFSR